MDYDSFEMYRDKSVNTKRKDNVKNDINTKNTFKRSRSIDDNLYELSQEAVKNFIPEGLSPEFKEVARLGLGYVVYEILKNYRK